MAKQIPCEILSPWLKMQYAIISRVIAKRGFLFCFAGGSETNCLGEHAAAKGIVWYCFAGGSETNPFVSRGDADV